MSKYRIELDKETCIGCGACTITCPDNWEMKGDKSNPKKTESEELGCNKDAAEGCPVNAIHLFENRKKII